MQKITLGSGVVVEKGMRAVTNKKAEADGFCRAGIDIEIYNIENEGPNIVVFSHQRKIPEWHDYHGNLPSHSAYVFTLDQAREYIDFGKLRIDVKVAADFHHRGKNLRGKEGRIVYYIDGKSVAVEFKEFVDGHSADANGKTGHCLILPVEVLHDVEQKKVKASPLKKDEEDLNF